MIMKMVTNLAGVTFLDDDVKKSFQDGLISIGDEVHVEQVDYSNNESESLYDCDYSVRCNGHHVGWIPQLKTIKSYIRKEFQNGSQIKHDWQVERAYWVGRIRDCITLDLYRNNIIPRGKIENLYFDKKLNAWSVSVVFNYYE
tara:strand:- start:3692 stop:4120 length:429 start_codon:yes stop_codon:yes gene_type:complete